MKDYRILEKVLKYAMMFFMYLTTLMYTVDNTYDRDWLVIILFAMFCIYVPLYFYHKAQDNAWRI